MREPNESVARDARAVAVLALVLSSSASCGGSQAASSSSNTLPSIESSAAAGGAPAASAADMPAPPANAASSAPAPSAPSPAAGSASSGTSDAASADTRDINDIRSTISASRERFRACYDQALKKDSRLAGKFVLRFVVHPNGSVKSAEVDNAASQIHVDEMASCAIGVLRSLRFPPSKKGMESSVNYPFDFHPRGPAK